MNQLLISLLIGIIAGVIDIIPMIIKKLDLMFILSAFSMWVIMGLLLPRVQFTSIPLLNGIILAVLLLIPLFFLIIRLDRAALPQICITTILLGAGIGFLNSLLLK